MGEIPLMELGQKILCSVSSFMIILWFMLIVQLLLSIIIFFLRRRRRLLFGIKAIITQCALQYALTWELLKVQSIELARLSKTILSKNRKILLKRIY